MKLLLITIGLTGCASKAAGPAAPVEHELEGTVAGVLASSSGEQVTIDQAVGWVRHDDIEGWAWPTIVLLGGGTPRSCADVMAAESPLELAPVVVVMSEAQLEDHEPTQVDRWDAGGVQLRGPIQSPNGPDAEDALLTSAQVTIHERRGDRWSVGLEITAYDAETGGDRPLASGQFDVVWCGELTAP